MAINLGSAVLTIAAEVTELDKNLAEAKKGTDAWAKGVGDSVVKMTSGAIAGGAKVAADEVAKVGLAALDMSGDFKDATKQTQKAIDDTVAGTEEIQKGLDDINPDPLADSFKDTEKAVGDTADKVDQFGQSSKTQINDTVTATDDLKDSFSEVGVEAESASKKLGDALLKLTAGAIAGGVTVVAGAVVGIGAAALSASGDISGAVKKAQSSLGALNNDATLLGDTIKNVYANNFGGSIEEVGAAVTVVSQQMNRFGQLTQEELQAATERAYTLSDAFGIDIAESTGAVNTLMENFGLTSDEAFTLLQSGLQNGLNNSGDLLDTIGEYSNQFAQGGASAAEFFSFLDSGLQGGMLGTDKAADLFKEFTIRIKDGSKTTSDSLQALGLDIDQISTGLSDGSLTAMDVFPMIQKAIRESEDPVAAFNAAVGVMGTQFEDLGMEAVLAIDPALATLEDWASLTSDINTQYDSFGAMFEGFKRQTIIGLTPLTDILLLLANQAMPAVTDAMNSFLKPIKALGGYISFVREEGDTWNDSLMDFPETIRPFVLLLGELVNYLVNGEHNLELVRGAFERWNPALVPVIDGLTSFVSTIREFVTKYSKPIIGAIKGIALVFGGFLAYSVALSAWASLVAGVTAAFAALASPIVAVAAVAALLFAAWDSNFAGMQETVQSFYDAILQVWGAFKSLWAGDSQGFLDGLAGAWETYILAVATFIGNLWSIVSPLLAQFYNSALSWFNSVDWLALGRAVTDKISLVFSTIWEVVSPYLSSFYNQAYNWFWGTDWWGVAQSVVSGVTSSVSTLWDTVYPYLESFFTSAYEWFVNTDWLGLGQQVIDQITLALSEVWTYIEPTLTALYTSVSTWFLAQDWKKLGTDVVTFILDGLALILTEAAGLLSLLLTTLTEVVSTIDWASVGSMIGTALVYAIGAVVGLAALIAESLYTIFEAIYTWATEQDWYSVGLYILEAIVAPLLELAGSIISGVVDLVGGVMSGAGDTATGLVGGDSGGGGASGNFAAASDTTDFTNGTQNMTTNNANNNSVTVQNMTINTNGQSGSDVSNASEQGIRNSQRARGRR